MTSKMIIGLWTNDTSLRNMVYSVTPPEWTVIELRSWASIKQSSSIAIVDLRTASTNISAPELPMWLAIGDQATQLAWAYRHHAFVAWLVPISTYQMANVLRACQEHLLNENESSKVALSNNVYWDRHLEQIHKDNHTYSLTPLETEILELLWRERHRFTPVDEIIRAVWNGSVYITHHSVYVYIKSIRDKVECDPHAPKIIVNRYRFGYRLTPAFEFYYERGHIHVR